MPKTETSIWLALKSRVDTLPLTYARAWPGQAFEPPSSGVMLQPYLRVGRVSATPIRRMIAPGEAHERTGSLMITLVHPLGQNISVYDQLAATISEHFRDGTRMTHGGVCVEVTAYPHAQDGYEDNGYWVVPVRIPWRCFA